MKLNSSTLLLLLENKSARTGNVWFFMAIESIVYPWGGGGGGGGFSRDLLCTVHFSRGEVGI